MRSMMPFMDGATQRVRDFGRYGNHGTPEFLSGNDSEFITGSLGQGVDLDGGNDRINLGNAAAGADLDFVGPFTLETWLISDILAGANTDILSRDVVAGVRQYNLHLTIGGVARTLASGVGVSGTTVVGDGNLHQVIATWDGATLYIAVDGEVEGTVGLAAMSSSANTTYIGMRSDGTGYFNGKVFRVRMWNRPFGAAEIYNRYINRFRV